MRTMNTKTLWRAQLLILCALVFMFALHAKTAVYSGSGPAKVTPSTASKLWLSGQKMEVHSVDSSGAALFWMALLCLVGLYLHRELRAPKRFFSPTPKKPSSATVHRFLRPPPVQAYYFPVIFSLLRWSFGIHRGQPAHAERHLEYRNRSVEKRTFMQVRRWHKLLVLGLVVVCLVIAAVVAKRARAGSPGSTTAKEAGAGNEHVRTPLWLQRRERPSPRPFLSPASSSPTRTSSCTPRWLATSAISMSI